MRRAFRGPVIGLPVVGLLGLVAAPVTAQDAAPAGGAGRTVAVVPTLSVSATFTDNRRLTDSDRQSSLISEVSPGVHLSTRSGRVQGDLDYSLNSYSYTHGSGENNLQNSLNGALHAEAVENWAFLDASATISQQSISALGTQTPDPSLQNANQSEVGNYFVAPSLRGSFAGLASYDARASYQIVHSDGFSAADSRTNGASFAVRSDSSNTAHISWSVTATHQGIAYDQSRSTLSNRVDAKLDFALTPELSFSGSGGREWSNLTTVDNESTTTWGFGVDWRPSDRTRLSYTKNKRIFGESHSLLIEFRTPRTVWLYADSQDVTTSAATGVGSTQTAYDLLYAQYASLYPDPTLRAQMVNAALASSGIAGGTLVSGGFLSGSSSLQRRQEASFALTGLRATTLLTAYQTRTSQLDPLASQAQDDLSTQGTVRQRGIGATLSYRLTPASSANLALSLLRSSASASSLATNARSVTLTWGTRIGPHANLSLSGRHVAFSSSTSPYHESALIAGLGFRF